MRQTYLAGDKLFVDWAGDTVDVVNPQTGEVHAAHLFVAVLGASSYPYAQTRWTETLPDWIGAHANALDFIGGVMKASVPDNLKTGITKPSRLTSRASTGPIRISPTTTAASCCPPASGSRPTRRTFHTAPCSVDGAVIGDMVGGVSRAADPNTSDVCKWD